MEPALALAVVALAASVGIGLIFLTGGLSKLRHRILLPGVIANYRLLPPSLVAPVAIALPFVEILTGGALLVGIAPVPVIVAILLLGIFAVAMGINIVRGRSHIDCGCGRSHLRHAIGWPLVGRNGALALLLAPRLLPAPALLLGDRLTAMAGGLALYLAYLLFNSIGALIASPTARR
ncbi:MAG: methylamine utilization protein MauE [bacterium]|nr:methylamine utilization protein MauE [bacterium]